MRQFQGLYPVIDYHAHFMSAEWFKRILNARGETIEGIKKRNARLGVPPFDVHPKSVMLNKWIEEIEKYQLEKVVLFIPQEDYLNVAPLLEKHTDKFKFFYYLHTQVYIIKN